MSRLLTPVLALGIAAAACTDTGVRPKVVSQAADRADQVMFKLST